MVPYWISSTLVEEILQMSFQIPSVMINNDELLSTSTNGVVSGEWTPINRVANGEFLHYNANNEYTANNVLTSDDYLQSNVKASSVYISNNNALTRGQYNISDNVLPCDEYIPNNALAIDGFLSSNVASSELLPKNEITCVEEIPYSEISSDRMLPNNGTVSEQGGPGALVAGEALPNIASGAELQDDSDDDLLREYDVDVSLNINVKNVLCFIS